MTERQIVDITAVAARAFLKQRLIFRGEARKGRGSGTQSRDRNLVPPLHADEHALNHPARTGNDVLEGHTVHPAKAARHAAEIQRLQQHSVIADIRIPGNHHTPRRRGGGGIMGDIVNRHQLSPPDGCEQQGCGNYQWDLHRGNSKVTGRPLGPKCGLQLGVAVQIEIKNLALEMVGLDRGLQLVG